MDKIAFQRRTKSVGIQTIQLIDSLPKTRAADAIARQIVRSATSVGANYRAACRAKSTKDMIYKLKIVEEEADETLFWFEIINETNMLEKEKTAPIMKETNEILAMTVASIKTLRKRK